MSDGEINVDSIDGEVLTTANIVGELYPQGEKGDKGDPGNDGFSPTVTTEKVGKTTTITITDAEGEHIATILDGADGQGSGDMRTEVYDVNQNGIVDDAEKVNGHTVGTDVPANAVFTDTTYTAGTGIDITGNVITNTQTSAEWGNITGTLSDQTDLKNALDDKADTSDIPTKVSDLNNDSGFIDKDVNNLTNYDTSTTVDTKISNSEEVLIGSDSGIKASHELWVDTSDVTPYVNSEISNSYGTAQNLGYSQEYVNDKLDEKLDADATAENSTKWDGWTNDLNTYDGVNTWIPVLVNGALKHTTIESAVDRGLLPQSVQTTAYYNFTVTCYKIGKLCIISIVGPGNSFTQEWTDYILAEIPGITAKDEMRSTFSDQQGRTGDIFILQNSNQIRVNYRGATPDPNNAWLRGQLVFVTN